MPSPVLALAVEGKEVRTGGVAAQPAGVMPRVSEGGGSVLAALLGWGRGSGVLLSGLEP